jgi:hypothetical protein
MYNNYGNPAIVNCLFSSNIAIGDGGGMYTDGEMLRVINCTFSGNKASSGGGMSNTSTGPTVTNCTFTGNTAALDGGGMNNFAVSSPDITNCTFVGNTAFRYGGAIRNYGGSNPNVTHCTFTRNTGQVGGGMYNDDGNPTVTKCTFSGNTSDYGGGIYNESSSPTVTDCMFSGNTALRGGGMVNALGSPTVTKCTFSGNSAFACGAMCNHSSRATVTNCILWGDNPDEIINFGGSAIATIRFSDVQGGLPLGTIDGGGNFDLDPMFVRAPHPGADGTWNGVDDDYGALRLRGGSPCIDAGDPAFVAQPHETDLDGHARVLCGRVDMGAYEFGIGDYDCDRSVNLTDFSVWSSCMTGPHSGPYEAGCVVFDFDGDGDVDLLDFGGFQRIIGP